MGTRRAKGPEVRFDSDLHKYWIDGIEAPGTSAVLRAAGILDGATMDLIPDKYRQRGLYVHEFTEALDLGQIAEDTPVPLDSIKPYIDAWRRFKREARPTILAVEELVCDRLRRFATRVDRRVILNGSEGTINLKTGGKYPHYPIQVALESMCYRVGMRRWCVYLSKEGAYRLEEHTDPRDFRVAESAIRTYYAKMMKEQNHAETGNR